MLSFPRDYRSRILDTIKPVCEVGIDIYRLSGRMGRKIVFELAESAEDRRVSSLLVNGYPDSLFAASGAREDGW
jgi:hypothetical protein